MSNITFNKKVLLANPLYHIALLSKRSDDGICAWTTMGANFISNNAMFSKVSASMTAKVVLAHTSPMFIHEPDAVLVSLMSKNGVIDSQLFAFKTYFVDKNGRSLSAANYALAKQGREQLFDAVDPTPDSVDDLFIAINEYIAQFKAIDC